VGKAHRGMRRPDPFEFTTIQEALASIRLDQIAAAIGVSRTAASGIRRGELVPHVGRWPALCELAGIDVPEWAS
jgi:hypothetical protein